MSRRRILVADDSATIQKVIKIAFSRHNYDIVEASSFIEAITSQSRGVADIIIADASLPGAHGPNDFLKIAHDGSVPLLLLVGSYESVDEDSFRSLGFTHFLKKPFESSDIVSLVEQLTSELPEQSAGNESTGKSTSAAGRDRSQHTTVFHEGGIGLSFSDGAKTDPLGRPSMTPGGPGASQTASGFIPRDIMPPPPPPQATPFIDETQKGRKAFSPDLEETMMKPLPDMGRTIPPPPPGAGGGFSMNLDDESGALPTIPSDLGLMSQSSDVDMTPPSVPAPGAREQRGRHQGAPIPWQPIPEPTGRSSVPALRPEDYLDKIEKLVEDSVDDRLPPLVRKAIEDYCDRHFKTLAREVITSELRRLAEEKARHLVDN